MAFEYLGLIVCGVLLVYSMSILAMSLSFWLVRLDNLFVGLEMLFSVGRTPLDVFRAWGSAAPFVLTYVLPVAFLAAIPSRALFAPQTIPHALIAAPILTVAFLAASAAFWRTATRAYASASS
jgi:ABC-2 type transport system permease protein